MASAALAKPAPETDPYEAARAAESRLEYKQVIMQASRALEGPNTHERLVNLYQMLGTANAVLGKTDAAIDAFTKLLAIDPEHRLPRGTSPKINGPYKEAGGYWLDRPGGLQVTPTLPREIVAAKPLAIPVKIDDPLAMSSTVRVNYRLQGDTDYQQMETPVGPTVTFNIPAEAIPMRKGDFAMELYFTVLSSKSHELRLSGDAQRPMTIIVHGEKEPDLIRPVLISEQPIEKPKKKPPAFLKKWWFWAAIGGVVVAGAAVGGTLGWYYSRDTSHVDIGLTSRTGP